MRNCILTGDKVKSEIEPINRALRFDFFYYSVATLEICRIFVNFGFFTIGKISMLIYLILTIVSAN